MLVDDQQLIRGAIGALLELEGDLAVVASVGDAAGAVEAAERLRPDVCLMDIQLPGIDGIEATGMVLAASPATRVLMVTTFARPGYLRSAVAAGARGFLVKDAPPAELAAAVRRVHAGLRAIDPALAEESLFDGASPLSPRERDVLTASADGRPVRRIAEALFLSQGTVRNHLSAAIGKTGAANRAEAARIARDRGWI
ncbi:response regulator transcription factor [Mycetocola reblochoni]|uniref:DNA-binding response regulator n=2 Tax=Mycetocola reblochoni TaxID=331618 RepID=A0A3L6ZL85_9MICO|nr:response regulator transcription factor [Mycetocola reblochoni]RLP68271.1 DNA-binding response regulator [Mycetocola reblochoni]